MYHRYFGLREEPFSIAVNPRYLFVSDRHRDALAHMLYGVGGGGGFVLLTGEVGTGKTTISRCLLEQLPDNTDVAIVLNPALNAEELLATVCDELRIEYDHGTCTLKNLTDRLHAFLLENHRRGRRTVLLIDEAQHLQFDVLEQIRLLTNLETDTQKLLQIILVGQPELSAVLARPELRQLSQRISARFELRPLNLAETSAYINHRLQVAGLPASQNLFPAGVVRALFRRTGGIPRLINLLCERMLLGSYGRHQTTVNMAVFQVAAAEVFGTAAAAGNNRFRWRWALPPLALIGVVFWLGRPYWPAGPATAESPAALNPAVAADSPAIVFWQPQFQAALAELARFVGMPADALPADCSAPSRGGWDCLTDRVDSWNQLLDFGRPAVLSLVTPERFQVYAVLIAVTGGEATLLLKGETGILPMAQLAALWRGEFTLLWQPPEFYRGPIGEGENSPIVAWLAQEFASLDAQPEPLAQQRFNAALTERVRYFQRSVGLRDDGLVGVKTLLKLQQVRGRAPGLGDLR